MNPKETDPNSERHRMLAVGLLAFGAGAVAALFAPVESREAAPVLGILWLVNLSVGALCLLIWASWSWLEPRRRRSRARWETRLVCWRLRHHQLEGTIDKQEVDRLEAWIRRREGDAPF